MFEGSSTKKLKTYFEINNKSSFFDPKVVVINSFPLNLLFLPNETSPFNPLPLNIRIKKFSNKSSE